MERERVAKMKKIFLLLLALLFLAPLAKADAAQFTLTGLKKAGAVWMNHGDGDGSFNNIDWVGSSFDQGLKLTERSSPKQKSLTFDYDGNSPITVAIFKKNGNLQKWGLLSFDGVTSSFTKLKRKKFDPHALEWTIRTPAASNDGGTLPSSDPIVVDGGSQASNDGSAGGPSSPTVGPSDAADKGEGAGQETQITDEAEGLPELVVVDDETYVDVQPAGGGNSNSTAPVPEPATMLLLGAGLIAIAGFARGALKK
jgi:hypothetical protein